MGLALITCCKINGATKPGCSCFSCFQQETLSVVQINPVLPYLQPLHSSVSTQLTAISTSAMHPCRSSLMPAGLEGESQSFCIVLLQWSSGLTGQNWLWWEQEPSALVSHPAFLSSSLSVHTHPQISMETQGELNGSELPGESGTTWGNNPVVNAFPPCSLTAPHHP